jgi:hypothetical protein
MSSAAVSKAAIPLISTPASKIVIQLRYADVGSRGDLLTTVDITQLL